MNIDNPKYKELASRWGEDMMRIMCAQEEERQKNKKVVSTVERYGAIGANLINATQNMNIGYKKMAKIINSKIL